MAYLTPDSKRALSAAVQAIELASSAEVVVVMQPSVLSAATPSALAALGGAALGLAFLLWSPWPFSNAAILLDTALCGIVAALVCRRFASIRRLFTPRRLATRATAHAAAAEFLERGVAETRGRSGVLIYVAQLERCAAVLADRGVTTQVDAAAWHAAVAQLESCVRDHADGMRLALQLQALVPLLANALPRAADDRNELDDAVVST